MKKLTTLLLAAALLPAPVMAEDLQDRVASSRAATKQLFESLKAELEAGMKAGGPKSAIPICSARAPGITQESSDKAGFSVMRTSHKVRNPKNAPDAWEQKVMEAFLKRKADGEDPMKMEHYEVVEADGKRVFRYMKAIPTADVCLKCHGKSIDAEVTAVLDELYPEDTARDFDKGDIRGAFSIKQEM